MALVGLVTVAVAAPATAAAPAGGHGGHGGGGSRPAPSVDGVRVGWLPRGVSLTGVTPSTRIGRDVFIGTFEGGGTRVQLTVQRSTPDATFDDVLSAYTQYYPATQIGRIALRGTEAVTLGATGTGISEATWVEGDPSVVLTVGGGVGGTVTTPPSPLPRADLLRIAESLTVGPPPPPVPAAWQTRSKPLISAAFVTALNSSTAPPRVPLAAVENGQNLVGLLTDFRAAYPGLSAQITVNEVTLWATDRASVTFTIAYQYQGRSGSIGTQGQAVFARGSWKVTEQTYRSVLALASALGSAPA